VWKKRVFIGSSSQARDKAESVAYALEELGCDVICWWHPGVFPVAKYTLESLLSTVREVDAAIFILAEDDVMIIESDGVKKKAFAVRDNVLLEAGLFYGILGRDSVALCVFGSPKIPSDWEGITRLHYDLTKPQTMKEKLKQWINNAKYVYNKKPHNVHMQARNLIHDQYALDKRLGISSGAYKDIAHIKILNLASNLLVNPEYAERQHLDQDPTNLSEVMYSLLKDTTHVAIQLILLEPNKTTLKDTKSKIANSRVNSDGSIYSAQHEIYELITKNEIYKTACKKPIRFNYYVTDIIPPFAIFNVEFKGSHSYLNHVKIDLYSADLSSENDRRSMVIWEMNDKENYDFFVNNFNNIRRNHARSPREDELKKWSDIWLEMSK